MSSHSPHMQSAPDEREAFEAAVRFNWASAPLHYIRDALPKDDPRYGQYVDETLQGMWVGWQGRAAWQRAQSAPAGAVPEGWCLVPERMELLPEDIAAIMFHCGGDEDATEVDEMFNAGILWVGEVDDDGRMVHGLQIATADYPEEGSTTLVEFAAAPQPAAPQELGDEVRRLREAVARADEVLAALTACTTPLDRLERKFGKDWCQSVDKVRSELIAALSASAEGK